MGGYEEAWSGCTHRTHHSSDHLRGPGRGWGGVRLEYAGQRDRAAWCLPKPIPSRKALTHHTQPGSIYLLTPVGKRPIHIGFEVDGGCGVRQPAVHLPALYLTCGRKDALEPIWQPLCRSPCAPCSVGWSPATSVTLATYQLCVALGQTSIEWL